MTSQPGRHGGHLWGKRRVDAGISLNQLAAASGIGKGLISLMENGRLIPTAAEYGAIQAALEELEKPGQPASGVVA